MPAADTYPLTSAQRDIWLDQLSNGDSPLYTIGGYVELTGDLRPDTLRQALQQLVAANPVLRTELLPGAGADGLPVQRFAEHATLALPLLDLSAEADPAAAATALIQAQMGQGYRFDGTALLRFALIRLGPEHHWLATQAHHLILDGWGFGQMLKALGEHYTALLEGGEAPRAQAGYADFIDEDRQYQGSIRQARDRAYWLKRFASVPEPLLAARHHYRRATDEAPSRTWVQAFPDALHERMKRLAEAHQASAFHVLLAALHVLFSRSAQREDWVVGLPLLNRGGARFKATLGTFVQVSAVPLAFSPALGFAELVVAIRDTLRRDFRHQRLAVSELNRALGLSREERGQLFEVSVSYEQDDHDYRYGEASAHTVKVSNSHESTPLAIHLRSNRHNDKAWLHLVHHRAWLASDEAEALAQRLLHVLDQGLATPALAVADFDLPTPAEHRQMQAWNATGRAVGEPLVHRRIEAHAALMPEAIAAVHEGRSLSYGELNQRANALALRLIERGVRPEQRVAVVARRGLDTLVGLLAVLKAGAAYVPIDPAHPRERIAYLLEDSAPVALLIQQDLLARLPRHALPLIELDACPAAAATLGNPRVAGLVAESLVYVIYTSGSTGQPKGVMVEHRMLANLVDWHCAAFDLGVGGHTSSLAGFGFDAMAWEVWPALCAGATLHLAPTSEGGEDIDNLLRWWRAQPLQVSFLPTPVAEHAFTQHDHPTLRTLLVGGDRLRSLSRERAYAVINNYGPTEATVVASSGRVMAGGALHIGTPVANTRLYVLDAQFKPLPVGVPGELYVAGLGVARGYLNRPQMTAERFLDDPFSDEAGARMYRSGDRVRWLADGTLEYLGRNDDQVKIRGVRVELGEIEAALASHGQVREAVVLLRDGQLQAWYIGDAVTPGDLHEHLRGLLPAALLPIGYQRVDHWPLTANGKLDRRALPVLDETASVRRAHEAPRGDVEVRLAALWGELLGVQRIGRHDHFFELGGHSLLAVQLVERMRQQGLQADVQVLFGQPTLASLAAASQRSLAQVEGNRVPADCSHITPELLSLASLTQGEIDAVVAGIPGGAGNVQEIYPLAPLQQGLLYHHLRDSHDPYQQQALFAFTDQTAFEAFAHALQQVVERHDILRTSLAWEGLERPQQVVWRQAQLPVEVLRAGPDDTAQALSAHYSAAQRPLDLRRAPMMALAGAEDREQGRWLGLLRFHHLVNDAVSVQVLLGELRALMSDEGHTLPAPVPYRNYVALSGAEARQQGHEAFLRALLAGVEAPPTLPGMVEDHVQVGALDSLAHEVPLVLTEALRRLARQQDVGLASLFHLAWAQVLGALGGRDDVVFGSVLLGRMMAGEGADRALGMFINSLPLRVSLTGRSVAQALADTHAGLAALLGHEDAPLLLAQRCSGLPAGVPLFNSLINFRHGLVAGQSTLPGARLLEASEVHSHALVLSVDDQGEALHLNVRAPRALGAARVLAYLERTLEGLVEALEQGGSAPIEQLCSVPENELQRLLHELNATEEPHELMRQTLPALFQAQVLRTPDAVALQTDEAALSYRDLDEQANRLAHHLVALGVQPDTRVGVCIERGLSLLVGLLGVLKAGGAYVPLDPGYPDERLRYMVEDSTPLAVLVHGATRGLFDPLAVPLVDLDLGDWQVQPAEAPEVPALTPSNLAYVMYTSGSTGMPKGVMIEHRGLGNLMYWGSRICPPRPGDALLQRAPFSFDGSVWELFWPLCAGLRLVLARPDGHRDPAYLVQLVQARQVTTIKFVPALLHQFLEQPGVERCTSLTDIFCGGGELTLALAASVRRRLPQVRLHNVYGPTEATVDSTAWTLEPDQPLPSTPPPIGRAIANTRLYVLDAHDRPVPLGVAGELHIGGIGVARGYLGLPVLQAERFIDSPFVEGDRLYRTGDLVRYREDGALEFLGRNDFQVKLRGLRVELGEIEALLGGHPALGQTVVLVRDERLVAYFTCREGQPAPALDTLRSHLLARLPEYMVPSAFVVLADMPLSPNGKIDRKALPEPGAESVISRAYAAPRNALEQTLAQIWSEVLKVEQVGRDDNFFELGGHSLLAVNLVARMRQAGLQADARTLFRQPTLAGLAASTGWEKPQVEIAATTIPGLKARRRI
ncbi:non-ribosomal peptide synthetase [Pseudomonas putida]|uniref:non-ribosomal peptide synthetase n=1 Tax=Pseudomonas putida TaxID=303 RepID=UPI00081973ED|nr:non-ribosomal peptide synthetase [Pseudomonas putida]OCT22092.1 non-ribosomal peptide synthetase [Pseudomonas putida]OCT25458.1 non-ribosomal peptide synthetase [Pseudomonas putida]OCT26838.1 non-ribosomal peptide synthetase [Pseudomonas putida]OCT40501.1 non-ribosomal peptide synthetase [Pseudomonas putida]